MKTEISVTVAGFWFVCWAFIFFWGQGGWYRVDCSLGVERACDLIKVEYSAKQKP